MKVVMIGPFGMTVNSTMRERALPMARALVRRGYQVCLLVPPWDDPPQAGRSWVDDGVRIINAPLPDTAGPLFHYQLTTWLVRAALREQPDVIHLFKPKAYAGLSHLWLYLLKQLRRHQSRLVVDEDDWELAWNKVNDYSSLQKRFFAWQEPWGLRHADSITVASKALQRLVEWLDIPRYRVFYVPNGMRPLRTPLDLIRTFSIWQETLAAIVADGNRRQSGERSFGNGRQTFDSSLTDFSGKIRAEYDLFGRPLVLLYTRFVEFQVEMLLQVIRKVDQLLPETRWLVAGEGYFGEEDRLQRLAEEQHLSEKLVFVGWVAPDDLPHYFATVNVALHLYEDNILNRTKCSVKLLDLLSAGVPVVASRVGQNSEYIVHGKTGLLIPPHNLDAIAEAVVLVLTNRHIQRLLGQEAAQHVRRAFSWDTLIEGVEAAYAAT